MKEGNIGSMAQVGEDARVKIQGTQGALYADKRALNAICPYFTMFPLDFPYEVLSTHAKKGQWVLDPFCGRGTTNFACRLLGLPTLGMDSSRVAVATSEAKLVDVTPKAVVGAASRLLRSVREPHDIPQGDFWSLAFHPSVLSDLCRLREGLLIGKTTDTRKALLAIILGALHGPLKKDGTSTYFSNQCPRTFAPKPAYSAQYWRRTGTVAPPVDVLQIIEERAQRYYGLEIGSVDGKIALADSRSPMAHARLAGHNRVDWVVTSPPYYGMRTYIPDQWLRNWFLGGPSTVHYSTEGQLRHHSPAIFAAQLRDVWSNVVSISNPGARMVVRFGGIKDRTADPLAIIRMSLDDTPWTICDVVSAGTADHGKRQADHFLRGRVTNNGTRQEYDVWAALM